MILMLNVCVIIIRQTTMHIIQWSQQYKQQNKKSRTLCMRYMIYKNFK